MPKKPSVNSITIYVVSETGSGYGASINAFTTEEKAKKFFEQLVNEYDDFTNMTPEEQKEVLDNEELRCHDDNVMKIIPTTLM